MPMYYKNRSAAGTELANLLAKYKGQPSIVISLTDGGASVGAPIADALGAHLTMLLLEPVMLPGEPDTLLTLREDGKYTFSEMWSAGQLEEFETEYRTFIEQAKQQKYSELQRALGVSCIASSDLLHDKNIILVSDGIKNGSSLDAAKDFLKPVKYTKLIIAVPLATANAVDKMRLMADEVICLNTVSNYLDTNHYYQDNALPSHEDIISTIEANLFPAESSPVAA